MADLESWQCLPEPPDEQAELSRVSPLERRRVVELGVALGRRVRLQLADPPHPILLAVQLNSPRTNRVCQVCEEKSSKIEDAILINLKRFPKFLPTSPFNRANLVHEVGGVRAVDAVVYGGEVSQFVDPCERQLWIRS